MSLPRTAYVSFPPSSGGDLRIAGKLTLPETPAGTKLPAVVICHGSDGVDGRGEFHAGALNAAGIATLEIDMWSARGTARGAAARPRSPAETVPDAFGARQCLTAQPEIDPARIGVMGFSWGGVVTLLCATRRFADACRRETPAFAAHAAFYPVCWAYGVVPALDLTGRTGAPILVQTGEADTYDTPGAGERLAQRLRADGGTGEIAHIAYPGAGHGFDRDRPTQIITDPFSHEGQGGQVEMAFHPQAAEASRTALVDFFRRTLAAAG